MAERALKILRCLDAIEGKLGHNLSVHVVESARLKGACEVPLPKVRPSGDISWPPTPLATLGRVTVFAVYIVSRVDVIRHGPRSYRGRLTV